MNSVHVTLLAAIVCLVMGGLGGYYYSVTKHKHELSTCNQVVKQSQKKLDKFCQGPILGESQFGSVRVSEVVCNGKQELCFCGTPTVLGQ